MDRTQLSTSREKFGWTQQEAARRLGVSQSYYSQLEGGSRPVRGKLFELLQSVFQLPPELIALPPLSVAVPALCPRDLATMLGSLGYPGFAHLRRPNPISLNPGEIVVRALVHDDLDPRLIEALPWLLTEYSELDWTWLVSQCCVLNLQNRLGYLIALAERSQLWKSNAAQTSARAALERARLVAEDTLCRSSLPEAERKWVRKCRPPNAAHWNLLTTLTVEEAASAA